jgi:hypothetical protein
MNSTSSRPKKSPATKAQRKPARGVHAAPASARTSDVKSCRQPRPSTRGKGLKAARRRRESRELDDLLPTQLERDTMLTPEWVAESVVQEAEIFLNASLPDNFVERLAARTYYLYDRNRNFHKDLNRSGNRGRDLLFMFMRHWTAAWLKRECSALYKRLHIPSAMDYGCRFNPLSLDIS